MSFPQMISGKPGWEKQTSTSQKHKLGTKMIIQDRVFRYVEAGEAITAGVLTKGKDGTDGHQVDRGVSAASVGDTTITLTDSLTITEDQYKDLVRKSIREHIAKGVPYLKLPRNS